MESTAESGSGYLQINVTSANGAVPEEGAEVLIFDYPEEGSGELSQLLMTLKTDRSGQTPRIQLPAPPKSVSQTPNGQKPYSSYNIEISKNGFFNVEIVGVPIFDGITSIQKINLIPQGGNTRYPSEGIQIIEAPEYESLRGAPKGR